MNSEELRVAELIRDVFRGVTLGEGVGLRQAQGIDDREDASKLEAYRAQDEKRDWSAIPVADLNRCYSSLSFFDAEGMRFHLPAYLIADLDGTFHYGIIFHLAYFGHGAETRFSMLSAGQHDAVRQFLLLRLSHPGCEFESPMIEEALNSYWKSE